VRSRENAHSPFCRSEIPSDESRFVVFSILPPTFPDFPLYANQSRKLVFSHLGDYLAGNTIEIYLETRYSARLFTEILAAAVTFYIFLPVFYELQLSSVPSTT